jgi:hypothetical protein
LGSSSFLILDAYNLAPYSELKNIPQNIISKSKVMSEAIENRVTADYLNE